MFRSKLFILVISLSFLSSSAMALSIAQVDYDSKQSPVNGTLVVEMKINNVSTPEITDIGINESLKNKGFLTRGISGEPHGKVQLVNEDGEIVDEKYFRLWETQVSDEQYSNGTWSIETDRYYPDTHTFLFPNNYSAREIRVMKDEEKVFESNITQKLCSGQNLPHYCEYNNFDFSEDSVKPKSSNKCESTERKSLSSGVYQGEIRTGEEEILSFEVQKGETIAAKIKASNNTAYSVLKHGVKTNQTLRENLDGKGWLKSTTRGENNKAETVVLKDVATRSGKICYEIDPVNLRKDVVLGYNLTKEDIEPREENKTELKWKARIHIGEEDPDWLMKNGRVNTTSHLWHEKNRNNSIDNIREFLESILNLL